MLRQSQAITTQQPLGAGAPMVSDVADSVTSKHADGPTIPDYEYPNISGAESMLRRSHERVFPRPY